ncbi:MAG: DUF937 domain-containing protein [Thermoanaerobaculia bacterium]|nr:DUF937 domain-containing protein [Thermoanaerobaculia bacterium]
MSMMDILGQALQQQGGVQEISRELGIDEKKVATVAGAAIPMMIAALNKNASQESGASRLASAVAKDHDGSILDNLSGALSNPLVRTEGAAILGHLFPSNQQQQTTSALGKMSGLDATSVSKILMMLAPLVLGALGKSARTTSAPAGASMGGIDLGSIVAALTGGQQDAKKRAPEATDIFTKMLDSDGDGNISDDIASMGAGILGSLFKS